MRNVRVSPTWCTMMLHVMIDTILPHVGQWRSRPFPTLSRNGCKIAWLQASQNRSVLKNRAWNEYLIDLVTAEGMPENAGRPARPADVELALRAFESRIGGSKSAVPLVQGRMAA